MKRINQTIRVFLAAFDKSEKEDFTHYTNTVHIHMNLVGDRPTLTAQFKLLNDDDLTDISNKSLIQALLAIDDKDLGLDDFDEIEYVILTETEHIEGGVMTKITIEYFLIN